MSLADSSVSLTNGNLYIPHVRLQQPFEGSNDYLGNFLKTNGGLNPMLQAAVVERKSIYIAAPSEQDIRNLISIYSAIEIPVNPFFHAMCATNGTLVSILELKYGANSQSDYYITNKGELDCVGDVIIDGPLYLKQVVVRTDQRGCRLYVTGTVFVEGVPSYVGVTADQGANLQISSARGIFLGMSTIQDRLGYAFGLRGAATITANLSFNQKIIDDRNKITGLSDDSGYYQSCSVGGTVVGYEKDMDAGGIWYPAPGFTQAQIDACPPSGYSGLQPRGGSLDQTSRSVVFRTLVLNAPIVMSRYSGEFHGSVIAEFALFKVGGLQFFSDPALNQVRVLPLVNSQIFQMSAN